MSLLEKLTSGDGLTEAEKNVASFLCENRSHINELTLRTVAKRSYTSNATVLRLCRKLGFAGYRQFQITLIAETLPPRAKEPSPRRGESPFPWTSEAERIQKQYLRLARELPAGSRRIASASSVGRAAEWITGAERLFLYGGDEAPAASAAFVRGLSALGIYPILTPWLYRSPTASGVAAGDTALVLSCSGAYPQAVEREISRLRQGGCRVIEIAAEDTGCQADLSILLPAPPAAQDPPDAVWDEISAGLLRRWMMDSVLTQILALVARRKAGTTAESRR